MASVPCQPTGDQPVQTAAATSDALVVWHTQDDSGSYSKDGEPVASHPVNEFVDADGIRAACALSGRITKVPQASGKHVTEPTKRSSVPSGRLNLEFKSWEKSYFYHFYHLNLIFRKTLLYVQIKMD